MSIELADGRVAGTETHLIGSERRNPPGTLLRDRGPGILADGLVEVDVLTVLLNRVLRRLVSRPAVHAVGTANRRLRGSIPEVEL